jgi:hypothetical protein
VPNDTDATARPLTGPNGEPIQAGEKPKADLNADFDQSVRDAEKRGVDPKDDPKVQRIAAAIHLKDRPVAEKAPNEYEDFKADYLKQNPHASIAEVQKAFSKNRATPHEPADHGQNFIDPATGKLVRVEPGQTAPANAQTPQGFNTTNTPTMTQRTAAGRAGTVIEMAPEIMGRLDSMKDKIGPLMGRWDQFMQGKVGLDNPDFAALRSDLLMMSSAVALAHAQGRLPENLRQEFDHAINAPRQSADNLKATITTMLPWLKSMQAQGQLSGHPTQGGAIRARDPQGRLHEAPAGTALPAGWKAEK